MNSSKTLVTLMLITMAAFLVTGCSDDTTSPISSVDTTPPLAPIGVAGLYDGPSEACYLSWEVNTVDRDLAGYIVKVEVQGLETTLLATPVKIVNYVHENPTLDESAIYKVYSVDESGNESAASTVSLRPSHGSRLDEAIQ